MLQGIETAGRSFWRRPWLKRGCCANDDDDEYIYCYNPLHVSSNSVLIIRRSHCINTASGIVFCVSDRPVCRLRRNCNYGVLAEKECSFGVQVEKELQFRWAGWEGIAVSVCMLKRNCSSGEQVEKQLQFLLNLHTEGSLTISDAVLIQSDLLMMSTVLLETCRGLQ